MAVLPPSFYALPDATEVARNLLGHYLISETEGVRTVGQVVETEAYDGERDESTRIHIRRGLKRAETLYGPAGRLYIYPVYRVHYLFNIVTGPEGYPATVLIRAVAPTEGVEAMRTRRNHPKKKKSLTAGPGMLTQAFAVGKDWFGWDLTKGEKLWLEDRGETVPPDQIDASPRIGIDYAGADAALPWRFTDRRSAWLSR